MPAFYTHYIFGRLGYRDMEEGALKEMVRRHKKVYAFGLSGPDIFFYFAPDQLLVRPTPGSRMHEEKCGAFLRCMLREALALSGREREIGIAYLAGFIGHYALDVSCHPHVYAYIEEEAALLEKGEFGRVGDGELGRYRKREMGWGKRKMRSADEAVRRLEGEAWNADRKLRAACGELPGVSAAERGRLRVRVGRKPRAHRVSAHEKTGIHFRYECAMDHYFLEHYAAKGTGQLHQGKMVRLNVPERRVIARLVAAAYNKTYDKPNMSETSMRAVLFCVRVVQHLICDPYGKKEQILAPIERFVYQHPFLAGLFINDNCYGVGEDEWEKMDALFRAGRKEYEGMMEALAEVVESALSLAKERERGRKREGVVGDGNDREEYDRAEQNEVQRGGMKQGGTEQSDMEQGRTEQEKRAGGKRSPESTALQAAKARHERALRLFAQRIGSRSYHTGMPV